MENLDSTLSNQFSQKAHIVLDMLENIDRHDEIEMNTVVIQWVTEKKTKDSLALWFYRHQLPAVIYHTQ